MTFLDARFIGLVTLCSLTFFTVAPGFRPHVLTFWGVVFYLCYAPPAMGLVAALAFLTYALDRPRARWIGVALLVGLLVYFKRPGGSLVPLGFSFLAFELIHFAIERDRGKIRTGRFVDVAAFAFFFPARPAGPIKRYREFTASVAAAEPSPEHVYHGCFRILSGLFKKVVLANGLASAALPIAEATTPAQAWTAMLAYSLQIYFDFSAYSDIAIGVSRLMGIQVPENFRWPYLSPNVQEFWSRWHMSLSSWTRDYVFMPVGRGLFGTRLRARPGVIAIAGYMASFLTIGAWHGLRPNFLVWGMYHGLLVSAFHFYKAWLPMRVVTSPLYQSRLASWGSAVVTFLLVTIGWVFFRMDLPDAARTLRLMLHG